MEYLHVVQEGLFRSVASQILMPHIVNSKANGNIHPVSRDMKFSFFISKRDFDLFEVWCSKMAVFT